MVVKASFVKEWFKLKMKRAQNQKKNSWGSAQTFYLFCSPTAPYKWELLSSHKIQASITRYQMRDEIHTIHLIPSSVFCHQQFGICEVTRIVDGSPQNCHRSISRLIKYSMAYSPHFLSVICKLLQPRIYFTT